MAVAMDANTTKRSKMNKRVHSVAPSDLLHHETNVTEQHFQSFTRLKPGSRIQFRCYYPNHSSKNTMEIVAKVDDNKEESDNDDNDDNDEEDSKDEWLDGIFWKFVKISNHKHKSTLYFANSNTNNSENNNNNEDNDNENNDNDSLGPTSPATIAQLHLRQSSHESADSVGSVGSAVSGASGISGVSGVSSTSNKSSISGKNWGAVRAVCTRDRDVNNPSLGYIVFELPLDINYFRVAIVPNLRNNNSNNNNNISVNSNNSSNNSGSDMESLSKLSSTKSSANIIMASNNGRYPKLSEKQLASWSVEDVQQWMKYVCKMRQLSHFRKLELRNINGMKLLSCIYNHSNNGNYKTFSLKSIQILTGIIDTKLAEKIHIKLSDLLTRQKEQIRKNSIAFHLLYQYIMDPLKAMPKHQSGNRMRRNSIERDSEERKKMKKTLSKMDTILHQSVTSIVIYHDTKDSTSDEKALYTIESATDVDTDQDYHTDHDYHTDTDYASDASLDGKHNKKKKNNKGRKKQSKAVRFAGASVEVTTIITPIGDVDDEDDAFDLDMKDKDDENDNDNDDNDDNDDNGRVTSPVLSLKNTSNNNSGSSNDSANSEPLDDKEFRDDKKNGDNTSSSNANSKKDKKKRPKTAGGSGGGHRKKKSKSSKKDSNNKNGNKHKKTKSKSKLLKSKSKMRLKHGRSKTAKFYKDRSDTVDTNDSDFDEMMNNGNKSNDIKAANKLVAKDIKRKNSLHRHRQFNKTWTSVKDVFDEDMSAKARQFAKKKQFLKDIGALEESPAPGVPDIDHDFEDPSFMEEYNKRVLKEQSKQKKGVHSSNVYEDSDSSLFYSASRVKFDDSRLKNALTVTNWPEFQSMRNNLVTDSHSENEADDHKNNKKSKSRHKRHEKKKPDLWKEAPPITYRGYEKWLQKVENEIARVEKHQNGSSQSATITARTMKSPKSTSSPSSPRGSTSPSNGSKNKSDNKNRSKSRDVRRSKKDKNEMKSGHSRRIKSSLPPSKSSGNEKKDNSGKDKDNVGNKENGSNDSSQAAPIAIATQ